MILANLTVHKLVILVSYVKLLTIKYKAFFCRELYTANTTNSGYKPPPGPSVDDLNG